MSDNRPKPARKFKDYNEMISKAKQEAKQGKFGQVKLDPARDITGPVQTEISEKQPNLTL
jgi:hypothetical protein